MTPGTALASPVRQAAPCWDAPYVHLVASMSGESAQAKGADGARRAKQWLDATTRVDTQWVNPDPAAVPKLTFAWPHGGQRFSFDLAGVMKFGEFDGQMFFAECKNYSTSGNLAGHYSQYLAQCYVAYLARPEYCDHFMWISWAPHSVTVWDSLLSAETVAAAVVKERRRTLGVRKKEDAEAAVDQAVCEEVAKRLWMIILSEKQERLVISRKHRGVINAYETEQAS